MTPGSSTLPVDGITNDFEMRGKRDPTDISSDFLPAPVINININISWPGVPYAGIPEVTNLTTRSYSDYHVRLAELEIAEQRRCASIRFRLSMCKPQPS